MPALPRALCRAQLPTSSLGLRLGVVLDGFSFSFVVSCPVFPVCKVGMLQGGGAPPQLSGATTACAPSPCCKREAKRFS